MKILIPLFVILFLTFQCYGQVDPQKLKYLQKTEKYRRMKNTGRAITVIGGVLLVTGIVTITNSIKAYNNGSPTYSAGDTQKGFLEYLGGLAGLGAGIPLWAVGGHNQKKYEQKLQDLSVRFNASPQNRGFTITYRF
ncbi:MAG: hypothetical protein ABI663_19490 [Chryseolinea sp.]